MKSKWLLLVLAMASPIFAEKDIWDVSDSQAVAGTEKVAGSTEKDVDMTDDQSTGVNPEEDDVD